LPVFLPVLLRRLGGGLALTAARSAASGSSSSSSVSAVDSPSVVVVVVVVVVLLAGGRVGVTIRRSRFFLCRCARRDDGRAAEEGTADARRGDGAADGAGSKLRASSMGSTATCELATGVG